MKIAIDAGHGINTPGKNCLATIDPNETREWVLNNRIATRVVDLLNCYKDVETKRLDDVTGKTDIALKTRTKKANDWKADWVFSIHHNAGLYGKSGGGIVIFTYFVTNEHEKEMQEAIYNECVKRGGLTGRSQPLAQKNLAMVRDTKCHSLLIEYGFMDSTTDTPVILTNEYAENMAQATVAAIATQLELILKEDEIDMTRTELEAIVDKKIAESQEKVYHYWSEIPSWAEKPLKAMYDAHFFVGASPADLNINKTKLECLVVMAKIMKDRGIITY